MFSSLFRCGPRCLDGSSIFEIGRAGAGAPPPPAPEWWEEATAILTPLGGYLWVYSEGIAETVEQPVSSWLDVTGALAWDQSGASSLRPLLKADGILFDGVDDRLNGSATVAGWLARGTGPYTMGVGSLTNLSNTTSVFWAATSGSTSSIVNLNTQNVLGRAGGSTLFSAVTDTGPLSTWITVAGSGANQTKRRVSTTETLGSYGTQLAGIVNATLGARRTTSPSLFLSGRIQWVIAAPVALSSADMLALETILSAQGLAV